jgi:aspartyl-tRNA(Asn)/glutamyl-tRNA(Gln) amidotransferase subunit B
MPQYQPEDLKATLIVGMEVHVELATRSKMWTAAPNVAHPDHWDAAPNTLCDPVVIGMPGTLPVMNRQALEMAMLVGVALNCTIADYTKWDRKSYYYPDLPKNYQISQYDLPLCFDGYLDLPSLSDAPGSTPNAESAASGGGRVRIIRAHLEEDAGKLLHEAPGGEAIGGSIVDLNRAGTPLLEIVTQPDLTSADQCVAFAQALRDICRHLGVTEGIMQRGHIRFEPNINVRIETPDGRAFNTPIVEIKNLNSFRSVHGAVQYEFDRQVHEWLDTGVTLTPGTKSTRGWDDARGVTFLQREKEEAHDYRYFPDPDLVPVIVDDAWRHRVAANLPELPLAKKARYRADFGLGDKEADALVDHPATAQLYEELLTLGVDPRRAATLMLNNLARRANDRGVRIDQLGVTAAQVKAVADLLAADRIGSSAADKLLDLLLDPAHADAATGAEALAERHGLLQVSDTGALEAYVEEVLADPKNEKAVADIRGGKDKAIGALMGQIMKKSRGQANAKVVTELIKARLQA